MSESKWKGEMSNFKIEVTKKVLNTAKCHAEFVSGS
jgi:hypothetical protein